MTQKRVTIDNPEKEINGIKKKNSMNPKKKGIEYKGKKTSQGK